MAQSAPGPQASAITSPPRDRNASDADPSGVSVAHHRTPSRLWDVFTHINVTFKFRSKEGRKTVEQSGGDGGTCGALATEPVGRGMSGARLAGVRRRLEGLDRGLKGLEELPVGRLDQSQVTLGLLDGRPGQLAHDPVDRAGAVADLQ